jgi:hypothetical protein
MSVSLYRLLGDVTGTARAMAKKHKLCRDGVIWCWNCSEKAALMPSLHCGKCLNDHFKRKGAVGTNVNSAQTPADVEACK